jgi:hypothetical protein
MPGLTPGQLRQLARLGAEARLAQLDVEIAAIKAAYPDVAGTRKGGRPRKRAAPVPSPEEAAPAAAVKRVKTGKRRPMSAAERKAVSERMRQYWAQRRKAKK